MLPRFSQVTEHLNPEASTSRYRDVNPNRVMDFVADEVAPKCKGSVDWGWLAPLVQRIPW